MWKCGLYLGFVLFNYRFIDFYLFRGKNEKFAKFANAHKTIHYTIGWWEMKKKRSNKKKTNKNM